MSILKKLSTLGIVGVLSLGLVACGERVEVPPASVGMVLGANGYEGDIVPPSRFRLEPCFAYCDKLVVIEAGDAGMVEQMSVLMPKNQLMLGVDVRFTLGLSDDREEILQVFDRVTPELLPSGNYGTTLQTVYNVYGAAIVRNVVRGTLSQYSIEEVAANQQAVSEKLRQDIVAALARTPLKVSQFGLADIRYPDVIRTAMEATQERRIAIERAEADAQVKIREAQAQLEVQRARREADILEAETIAEANRILAEGVSPELIRYRELQVLESLGGNENVVFFPVEMMGTLGLENRLMQTTPSNDTGRN